MHRINNAVLYICVMLTNVDRRLSVWCRSVTEFGAVQTFSVSVFCAGAIYPLSRQFKSVHCYLQKRAL
jgi:hypothetical protein